MKLNLAELAAIKSKPSLMGTVEIERLAGLPKWDRVRAKNNENFWALPWCFSPSISIYHNWRELRIHMKYEPDEGSDDWQTVKETINRINEDGLWLGDCDDWSIMAFYICLLLDLECRILILKGVYEKADHAVTAFKQGGDWFVMDCNVANIRPIEAYDGPYRLVASMDLDTVWRHEPAKKENKA